MVRVCVIGGGIAGMVAAIEIKQANKKLDVVIYEKDKSIGKKILVTGNGRCNILNTNASKKYYTFGTDFTDEVLSQFPVESDISFFRSIGLKLSVLDEGRVYPTSNMAASVLQALVDEIENLQIDVRREKETTSISRSKSSFLVNDDEKFDAVIIAAGARSVELLHQMNIKTVPQYPCLTSLVTKENTNSIKGVRCKASLKVLFDGEIQTKSEGEIQYTDYGLSGIMVMDVSGQIAREMMYGKKRQIKVIVDNLPSESVKETKNFLLERQKKNRQVSSLNCLMGLLPMKLSSYILKVCKVKNDEPFCLLSFDEVGLISQTIHSLSFEIKNVLDKEYSQVTGGGGDLKQFSCDTLMSKTIDGLFVVGEALDVQGMCGGFNLTWAVSSARVAAKGVVKYLGDRDA